MKQPLLLLILVAVGFISRAQYVYTIKADSVKITGASCDSAELILQNHTQGVPGFLFNTGNGRTIFKRLTVDSLPGLQAEPRVRDIAVNVLGFYTAGDGGGGLFYWDDTSVAGAVPGMVISVSGIATGRWKRRPDITNGYNIQWFGGSKSPDINTDTVTDNTAAMRAAVQYIFHLDQVNTNLINNNIDQVTGSYIYIPHGFWRFTDSVNLLQGVGVKGDGRQATVLVADMENKTAFTRPPSYRSLFICYGGGSGGTGFPLVVSNTFCNISFRDFSITSTFADGGNGVPFHWTLKNGIELRNGFFRLEDLNINSCDSAGIYAFCLIGTTFERVRVDNCGAYGFFLDKDPANPGNTTTTTVFLDSYFRTTRRGPGFYANSNAISTSFIGTIFENNGLEDSTAGWGAQLLGDSSVAPGTFRLYGQHFGFYGCDFERNCGGKIMTNQVGVLIDQNTRYTGTPAVGQPDFYFRNSLVDLSNRWFQPNQQFNTPSIVVSSNTPTSSLIRLDIPGYPEAGLAFLDSNGNAQPYTWMRGLDLTCLEANGVGDIRYHGNQSTEESGYSSFGRDSSFITQPLLIGPGTSANAATSLDVEIARPVGLPAMTNVQLNTISSPKTGSLLWNTDDKNLSVRTATQWTGLLMPNASGNVGIGMGASTPTHTITLAPVGTTKGIALYNTVDDSVNYERFVIKSFANQYDLFSENGGTGVARNISIGINTGAPASIGINTSGGAGGFITAGRNITSNGSMVGIGTGSSFVSGVGTGNALAIVPTVNNDSVASDNQLYISPWYKTMGSGTHYLIHAGTNSAAAAAGTDTLKFGVDNGGNVYLPGTAGNPSASLVLLAIDTAGGGKVYKSWNPSAVLRAQAKFDTTVTLSANYTNATTTATNTGLAFPGVAGRRYALDCYLQVSSSSAVANGFCIGSSGNITTPNVTLYGNSTSDSAFTTIQGSTDGTVTTAFLSFGGTGFVHLFGTVLVNSGGTINVMGAAGTANTITVIATGSYMTVKQL